MDLVKDQVETWHINNRITQYLLNAIDDSLLGDALTSKGRDAFEQFAHIHNVRLMWLKVAAPDLFATQVKIEKEDAHTKKLLTERLQQSSTAIAELLAKGLKDGRIKNFKPHPSAFLGYLIAHDAHHRSQIIIALKQSGHKLDQKILYGMWEWGVR